MDSYNSILSIKTESNFEDLKFFEDLFDFRNLCIVDEIFSTKGKKVIGRFKRELKIFIGVEKNFKNGKFR